MIADCQGLGQQLRLDGSANQVRQNIQYFEHRVLYGLQFDPCRGGLDFGGELSAGTELA